MKHVPAVDSLRIICAFIVFGVHLYGLPLQDAIVHLARADPTHQHIYHLVLLINRALFNGAAAVMVFFIISGICIHWPVRARDLDVGAFLVRRFVRVGLPLIACVAVAQLAFGTTDFLDALIWSLYCELIYYAIYPLLRVAALRAGWTALFVVSLLAAVTLATQPDSDNGYFFAYGVSKTWLLGLPVWLTGVWLAEQHARFTGAPPSRAALNLLRFSVWFIAGVLITLQDRHAWPFKWSLLAFLFPSSVWIVYEIRNAHHNGVSTALERAGVWSFSLYLSHKFAIALVARSNLSPHAPIGWSCALVLGIVFSLLCYRVIELPSHALARLLAKRVWNPLRIPPRLSSANQS